MARRKEDTSTSSVSRRRKSKPLTNGEVVEILKQLPENRPFGTLEEGEKQEFLRQLYLPLHNLFKRTTSQTNRAKIQNIKYLEVLHSLYNRFPQFENDPLEFWERLVKALPQYSEQRSETGARARIFLEGAALLDSTLEEQRILRRFIAVSTYKLFRRAIPTSKGRVLKKNIEKFLVHVGLPNIEKSEVETYGNIIRRGQRQTLFCQKLAADNSRQGHGSSVDGDNGGDVDGDDGGEVDVDDGGGTMEDYAPLFFPSIPDSIWDEKGLVGKDFEKSIKHLKHTEVSNKADAKRMAKVLLDFHSKFVWIARIDSDISRGKRRQQLRDDTDSSRKRQRANDLQFPLVTGTSPFPGQNPRPAAEPISISQAHFNPNSGRTSSVPLRWQVSEVNPHNAALGGTSVLAHRSEQVSNLIPTECLSNEQEDRSRFETLVSAACTANPTNSFEEGPLTVTDFDFVGQTYSAPTHDNLIDLTALDFVGPLSPPPTQLDVTALGFDSQASSALTQDSLLDVTALDFVGPLSSVPTQDNILDISHLDFISPL